MPDRLPFDGMNASGYARRLKDEGRTAEEIQAALVRDGKTMKNAKLIVWHVFNRPAPRRTYIPGRFQPLEVRLHLPRTRVDALDDAAAARGVTREELAERILSTVLGDRIVDAVLDDQGAANGAE